MPSDSRSHAGSAPSRGGSSRCCPTRRGTSAQPPLEHRYGYRLEPDGDGTLVTSYYDWSHIAPQYRGAGIFPVIPEANLRATLGILARITARRDGTVDPA